MPLDPAPVDPARAPSLLRLALARKRGLQGGTVPRIALRATVPVGDHSAYARVCGFDGGAMPLTWPAVRAAPLHKLLLAHPDFPLPALGMVHIANRIEARGEVGGQLDLVVSVEGHREARQGVEVDLVTEVGGVWREVKTILFRTKKAPTPDARAPAQPRPPAERTVEWTLPADTGRRYGRVSGDLNPIHLSAPTARLFGYERAIAHGMWTLARALAELDRPAAVLVEASFRRPVFLPARVRFETWREDGATAFRITGEKDHVTGRVTPG